MASPIYVIDNTPTVLMAFEYSGRLNIIKFRVFAVSTHLPHGLVELESVCGDLRWVDTLVAGGVQDEHLVQHGEGHDEEERTCVTCQVDNVRTR